MGKKRRLLLAALLVAGLGAILWFRPGPRDPVYQGKPLTRWVDECNLIVQSNRAGRGYADYYSLPYQYTRQIHQFGPEAVPTLTRMLNQRHPLERRLYDFLVARKFHSAWASNYINRLDIDLRRPEAAVYILFCMGPEAEAAIPDLMRAAMDTNFELSCYAFNALGTIHGQTQVVVPFLINAANGTNSMQISPALGALGYYTNVPEMVLPTLVHALERGPRTGDEIVVDRFGFFGTNAAAAVPGLRHFAADTNRDLQMRLWAANSLRSITPDSCDDVTVPVYITILRANGFSGPYEAVLQLYALGPRAKAAVPALRGFISRPGPSSEATEAVYALKAVDPAAAAEIWPGLLQQSQSRGFPVDRTDASWTNITKDMRVPRLIAILTNGDASYPTFLDRQQAAHVLGELGSAAKEAIPALISQTNDLPAAFAALMKIRGQPVTLLTNRLGYPPYERDFWSWQAIVGAVGEFGTNAEPVVPLLVGVIEGSANYEWQFPEAAHALGQIRCRPDLCVPALTRLLSFPASAVRNQAVEALGNFGTNSLPAVPQLLESLHDLDYPVRVSATNALKQIDPAAAAKAGVQ